jgi:hypothetical protein
MLYSQRVAIQLLASRVVLSCTEVLSEFRDIFEVCGIESASRDGKLTALRDWNTMMSPTGLETKNDSAGEGHSQSLIPFEGH